MPFTPLHYPFAYIMRKAGNKAHLDLDMAGLVIGSFTPDLECPFFMIAGRLGILPPQAPYVQAHRLVLHSLLGSVTLGSLISMLVVMALYTIFERDLMALGRSKPGLANLYAACTLGNLSHVLIDAVHHSYSPLLFPFTSENVSAPVPLGDLWLGNLLVYAFVLLATALILAYEWRSVRGRLLLRLLFDV